MARNAAAPLPQQRSDVEVNLMHADWFASQGQIAQAIALYRTVGSTCRQRGDHRRAVTAFASVARLEGPGSDAKLQMGESLLALEQRADAARTLEQAGHELLSVGFVPTALHAFHQAAVAAPSVDRWRTYLHWSRHYGKEDDAIRHLAELTSTAVIEVDAKNMLGICELLLESIPGHVPTLRKVARACLEQRQVHKAVDAIQTILQIRPGDADALERMAEAFAALGKRHKAAEVMLRLAYVVNDRGPTARDEARRLVNRGVMWDPHNQALLAMQRKLDDRPKAVAREIGATASHPPVPPASKRRPPPAPAKPPLIDLSDFVEVAAYEQSVMELSPFELEYDYEEPPQLGQPAPMIPFPA
jgi:tetratricopeptide (TPR) repeat protein